MLNTISCKFLKKMYLVYSVYTMFCNVDCTHKKKWMSTYINDNNIKIGPGSTVDKCYLNVLHCVQCCTGGGRKPDINAKLWCCCSDWLVGWNSKTKLAPRLLTAEITSICRIRTADLLEADIVFSSCAVSRLIIRNNLGVDIRSFALMLPAGDINVKLVKLCSAVWFVWCSRVSVLVKFPW